MATVSHGGQSATYDWTAPVGGLPGKVTYSGVGITGTRTPDAQGRLDDITWRQGAGAASPVMLKNDYTLDDRGRRTATTREDNVNWTYGYNERSEVTSGARGGEQYAYQYDEIGNRKLVTETGVNALGIKNLIYPAANALNQYSAVPNVTSRKIKGQVSPGVTVSVNSASVYLSGTSFTAYVSPSSTTRYRKITVEGRKVGAGLNGQTIVHKKESRKGSGVDS